MTERISEAFNLVAEYCRKNGWVPVGHREFEVGDWKVRINGTPLDQDGLAPYHVLVDNKRYLGTLHLSPFYGIVGGFRHTEEEFLADMKRALGQDDTTRAL